MECPISGLSKRSMVKAEDNNWCFGRNRQKTTWISPLGIAVIFQENKSFLLTIRLKISIIIFPGFKLTWSVPKFIWWSFFWFLTSSVHRNQRAFFFKFGNENLQVKTNITHSGVVGGGVRQFSPLKMQKSCYFKRRLLLWPLLWEVFLWNTTLQ